jgi:hypothetical protein
LYIRTLAPGLLDGDSAEFQTIAYTLGIGHPAGYPVYVAAAKLFTLLPIREIAYRVNLFSAVAASLAVSFVFLATKALGCGRTAAVFAALSLALTPLFWRHAAVAEVYASSLACLALILFSVMQWAASKTAGWLFLAGALGGMSPGLHISIVLAAPALLLFLSIHPRAAHEKFIDRAKPALLGALTGLIFYLGLFIYLDGRNASAGYYNTVVLPSLSVWDMTPSDFDTLLERLQFLVFPPQFRGQFLARSPVDASERILEFIHGHAILWFFSLAGFLALFTATPGTHARARYGWFLFTALAPFVAFAATYDDINYMVFHLPSILILAITAGAGFERLVDYARYFSGARRPATVMAALVFALAGLGVSLAVIPGAWQERIPPGLGTAEQYGFRFPGGYKLKAEKIVNSIEDDAILFTDWDRVYGLYYVSHVLQGRTRLDFHQINPQSGQYLPGASMLEYIERNIDDRPIYFSRYPDSLSTLYQIVPGRSELFQVRRK